MNRLGVRRFFNRYFWCYVFIAVPVFLFLGFTTYPLIFAFVMSFQDYNVFGSEWVGLSNYEYVLSDPIFWRAMRVTLVFTLGTVPVNIGISLGLAWLISQLKEKAQTFFKAVYYLPAVASGVTVSLIWLWIFDPHPVGLLNKFIGLFGFDNVLWLGSSKTALFSLMLMTYLGGHGPAIILYLSAMEAFQSLYMKQDVDATSLLGNFANHMATVEPTTLYLLVTGVIGSFRFHRRHADDRGRTELCNNYSSISHLQYSLPVF